MEIARAHLLLLFVLIENTGYLNVEYYAYTCTMNDTLTDNIM